MSEENTQPDSEIVPIVAKRSPNPNDPNFTKGHLFAKGNKLGVGNPHAGKIEKFRAEIYKATKLSDFREIIEKLIEQAKTGDTVSINLLLDRLIGKVKVTMESEVNVTTTTPEEVRKKINALLGL